jgi:ATP-dependent DNA helicase RecG
MYEKIKEEFSDYKCALMHGELTALQKTKVLDSFRAGDTRILVSTSVIEVGIDVPNANVMVVESPQKFGLSQLHQLRGRVMRSSYKPYFAMVVPANMAEDAQKRIKVMQAVFDGFAIAEQDLKLRGPGDLFGDLQAGFVSGISSPAEDMETFRVARRQAYEVIKKDKDLNLPEHRFLKEHIKEEFSRCILWEAN